jgi:hypothetical protein
MRPGMPNQCFTRPVQAGFLRGFLRTELLICFGCPPGSHGYCIYMSYVIGKIKYPALYPQVFANQCEPCSTATNNSRLLRATHQLVNKRRLEATLTFVSDDRS